LAQSMPHPIYGEITSDGLAVQNLEVRVKHVPSSVSQIVSTDVNGFYQIDLGNLGIQYYDGNLIEVSLVYCESLTRCTKITTISGGSNEVTFDVSGETIPSTSVVINNIETCYDGSQIINGVGTCPIEPKEVTYICADGTKVDNSSDCPESEESWWMWILGVIAAFFAGAGGLKFYGGKYKHYHRGIVSYHDPNTRHSNLKYRHTRMNEGFFKCISDVKKIQEGKDLSLQE